MNPFTKFLAWIAKTKPTEVSIMPGDSLTPILTNQVPGFPATAGADVSAFVAVAQADAVPGLPDVNATAPTPAPAFAPTAVGPAAEAPKTASGNAFIARLEKIIEAAGHELPPIWAEAVALAKKAL